MTQATDTDIRELKTAIDGNTRAIATQSERIEVIGRSTEANTKAVEAIDRRLEALTKTTEAIAKATEANTKAIADLTLEMRLGFATMDKKIDVGFANVDTKFSDIRGDIKDVRGDIKALDNKFEERTKGLGQRLDSKELFQRGVTVTIVGGLLLGISKVLFGLN